MIDREAFPYFQPQKQVRNSGQGLLFPRLLLFLFPAMIRYHHFLRETRPQAKHAGDCLEADALHFR